MSCYYCLGYIFLSPPCFALRNNKEQVWGRRIEGLSELNKSKNTKKTEHNGTRVAHEKAETGTCRWALARVLLALGRVGPAAPQPQLRPQHGLRSLLSNFPYFSILFRT